MISFLVLFLFCYNIYLNVKFIINQRIIHFRWLSYLLLGIILEFTKSNKLLWYLLLLNFRFFINEEFFKLHNNLPSYVILKSFYYVVIYQDAIDWIGWIGGTFVFWLWTLRRNICVDFWGVLTFYYFRRTKSVDWLYHRLSNRGSCVSVYTSILNKCKF